MSTLHGIRCTPTHTAHGQNTTQPTNHDSQYATTCNQFVPNESAGTLTKTRDRFALQGYSGHQGSCQLHQALHTPHATRQCTCRRCTDQHTAELSSRVVSKHKHAACCRHHHYQGGTSEHCAAVKRMLRQCNHQPTQTHTGDTSVYSTRPGLPCAPANAERRQAQPPAHMHTSPLHAHPSTHV
jgi:hypothetical protein